jgi:hypothetical protein
VRNWEKIEFEIPPKRTSSPESFFVCARRPQKASFFRLFIYPRLQRSRRTLETALPPRFSLSLTLRSGPSAAHTQKISATKLKYVFLLVRCVFLAKKSVHAS